mmetsp:Transcript_24187/g.27896  ORF Transcript_24187/g.27896 Transcript_24187/m.27896 type:complete len:89 (-) Transcript_24187:466-732(-)
MVPNNIDVSNSTKLIVTSEAWPEEIRRRYSSAAIHETLKKQEINIEDITFRVIENDYIDEIKSLHDEWFPVYYSSSYFSNLANDKENF